MGDGFLKLLCYEMNINEIKTNLVLKTNGSKHGQQVFTVCHNSCDNKTKKLF